MSSLIWQAWPRITLEQSQTLYAHFAKQGSVVAFRSARRHLIGPSGQGIVVYKDAQSIEKLLQGQESIDLDLKHLFANTTTSSSQNNTQEQHVTESTTHAAERYDSSWVINIRNNHKPPSTVSTEAMLAKRRTKIARIGKMFERFTQNDIFDELADPKQVRSELRTILDAELQKIRAVERVRALKRNNRSEATASSNADNVAGTSTNGASSEVSESSVTPTSSDQVPLMSESPAEPIKGKEGNM